MKDKKVDKIIELYTTLVELGVVFYYGNEIIPIGEITDIEFMDNEEVRILLNEFEEYIINIEDFQENHYKTGVNYHSWEAARVFDCLISEY